MQRVTNLIVFRELFIELYTVIIVDHFSKIVLN